MLQSIQFQFLGYQQVSKRSRMHKKLSSPCVYMTSTSWKVVILKCDPFLKQLSDDGHIERVSRMGLLSDIKQDRIIVKDDPSFYTSEEHQFCLNFNVLILKNPKVEGLIGLEKKSLLECKQILLVVSPRLDEYFWAQEKRFHKFGSYSAIMDRDIKKAFDNFVSLNFEQKQFKKMLSRYIFAELNKKNLFFTISWLTTQEFQRIKEERQMNQTKRDEYIEKMKFTSSKKVDNPQEINAQQIKMQLEQSFYLNIQAKIQQFLSFFKSQRKGHSQRQDIINQIKQNTMGYRLYRHMQILKISMRNNSSSDMKLHIRQILTQFKQIYPLKKQKDPMLQHFLEIYYKIINSNIQFPIKQRLYTKLQQIKQYLWINPFQLAFGRIFQHYFQICTSGSVMKSEKNNYGFDQQKLEIIYLLLDVYEILSSDCFNNSVLDLLYEFYSKNIKHMAGLIKGIPFEKLGDCNFDQIRPLFEMYANLIKIKQPNYIEALRGLKEVWQQKLMTAIDYIQYGKRMRGHVKEELGQLIVDFLNSKQDNNFGLEVSLGE